MSSHHSGKNISGSSSNLSDSLSMKPIDKAPEVEETPDYISRLPNALLVKILSFLPTEDSAASCVLSKRWRYLWHSIYNFIFSKKVDYDEEKRKNFISFVDHVLAHSTCSKIKRFQLNLGYTFGSNFELEIRRWVSFAVEREVEDIIVYSKGGALEYELPHSLYTCSSLLTLELSRWVFNKGLIIAWNSLKTLKLDEIGLDDDDIVNLLSSCPALESLKLSAFGGFRRIEITSSNLKRLTLAGHSSRHSGGYESLEIIAPHLEHLKISKDLGYLKIRPVNTSSVVTASLTFKIECASLDRGYASYWDDDCRDFHQFFRKLMLDSLQKLSNATDLIVGNWLAEMLQVNRAPLPELRCKCLTLRMRVTDNNLYGVAALMQTSPLLETLNIHMRGVGFDEDHCLFMPSFMPQIKSFIHQSCISNVVYPSLKYVKVVGCTRECSGWWSTYKLFELSEFLLKNAVVLKKFVIVAPRRKCLRCGKSCMSEYLSEFLKKLLDIPRSSKKFAIIYEELTDD